MEDHSRTVASVTVYYRGEYLTGLVFDDTATADAFVGTMQQFLNHRGTADFTFRSEIKTVYDARTISDELCGTLDGTLRPQGTLMRIIRMIDRRNKD